MFRRHNFSGGVLSFILKNKSFFVALGLSKITSPQFCSLFSFLCIQVNADVEVQLSTGQFVKFSGSTKAVGQFISTKAVGSNERHDITHQYKYPEGNPNIIVFLQNINCCLKRNPVRRQKKIIKNVVLSSQLSFMTLRCLKRNLTFGIQIIVKP